MKPFDLEKALAGEPVRCRDESYKVIRLAHFPEVTASLFKLIVLFEDAAGRINLDYFTESGSYLFDKESPKDLFMATKKRTVYINVYSKALSLAAVVYFTKEDAESRALPGITVAIAIPVEIEE